MRQTTSTSSRPGIGYFDGEPFYQCRVDLGGSLLGHPVAGGHDDFSEVGAVAAHRFGEAGVDCFAGVVVGAVQEEHGESEFACVLCLGGIAGVRGGIHVPGVGAEEAGAGEGGGVDREVSLGDDIAVAGNGGRLVRAAKPAVVAADLSGAGGFASAGGVAFAEKRADGIFDVGLESGTGAVEVFFVEKLVLPLTSGVSGLGVGLAVDQAIKLAGAKPLAM